MRTEQEICRTSTSNTMLNAIQSLSFAQKQTILVVLHAALVPVSFVMALFVSSTISGFGFGLREHQFLLPYLVLIGAGFSFCAGLCSVPLQAAGSHGTGPVVLVSTGLVLASETLHGLGGVALPLGTHIVFGLGYFLLVLMARMALLHVVVFAYTRAGNRSRVLIYGAGNSGAQLAHALRGHKRLEPVAFVDDNVAIQGLKIAKLPVFSPLRIADIIEERKITRVFLAAPSMSQPKQAKLIAMLRSMGLDVQALPSFAPLIGEAPLLDKLAPAAPGVFLGRDEVNDTSEPQRHCYAGRVVLVTGAGGSIGMELCRQLLELGPSKLILFELSEVALYTANLELQALAEGSRVEIFGVLGSVTEARQIRNVIREHDVQVIIHAAAYKHVPIVQANPMAGLVNNVLGTQTIVQQAIHANVERFILISSDKAVRPSNVMGASKRLAEAVVHDAGRRSIVGNGPIFSTVRFGNVLGSSGSVVPLFQEQLGRGGPITVTDRDVRRYFMTVQEAVKLVLESGAMARGNEVFVLDMGEPVSILHLARQVIESAGLTVKEPANPHGDIEISITGLRPGEKLVEELTLQNDLVWTDHAKIFCSLENNLSEDETATALRRIREAIVSCDDDLARRVAMEFVESSPTLLETGEAAPKIA